MDATPSQYRRLGFVGGVNTVLERGILPTNAFSEKQNFRDKNIGFVSRKGHRKLHTTTDKAQEIKTLHHFIDKSGTKYLYAQRADGSVHKAANNPPTVTTGNFGSEILGTISNPISASSTEIDGHFLFADGARQCQVYSGQLQEILKFIVYKGSSTISPAVIVGDGLDDATSGGTYTGTANKKYYKVTIDNVDSPDTFKWEHKTSLDASWSVGATGVSIVGTKFLPTMVSNTFPYPYKVSSELWDISEVIYDNKSFDVAPQEGAPTGLFFNPDGTKMYIVGDQYSIIFQYFLSTPWEIETATYTGKFFDVSTQDASARGIFLSPDGIKAYILGGDTDTVYQYSLSIAWDISTASYDNKSFSVATQETGTTGLNFKSDGSKMYISGTTTNNAIYQYSLSIPWDISTASYDNKLFDISAQDTACGICQFNDDGRKMYVLGGDNDRIYQYSLSTAWDVSTASYTNKSFSIAAQMASPASMFFSSTVKKLYIVEWGAPSDFVYQYTLPAFWELSLIAFDNKSFSVATQEGYPTGIAFSDDGMKMYIVGVNTGAIFQYSLSTAYDISTASYDNKSFSIATQDTDPRGLAFNNDGTKVYVIGNATDTIYQYSLSTAWDISTASYDNKSFSVAAQDTTPTGLFFKPDGGKMYIVGTATDSIYQYTLSTIWDISTAFYDNKSFSVATQETIPTGLFFNSDGTKMYVIGDTNDAVYQYSLSTAWDINTADYDNTFFSIASEETSPFALTFNNDGTKMYIVGAATDAVYQYSLLTNEKPSYEAYRAFDDTTLEWSTLAGITKGKIKIDLGPGNKATATSYEITIQSSPDSPTQAPRDWTFEGSNDNINWTILDTQTSIIDWKRGEVKKFNFANTVSYRYYRLNVTANNGNLYYLRIENLQIKRNGQQALDDGVTIEFENSEGHNIGDYWVFETTGIPIIPKDGEDYTDQIWSDDINRVAVLDNLKTLNDYHAIYLITQFPASKFNFTISTPNSNATTATLKYWNGAWTSLTITDGTESLTGVSLSGDGSISWTPPADEIPFYHFGISGYIYQLSFSAQLDNTVRISRVTYETSEFINLENVWDGIMRDVIEGQVYNASEDKYSREPGTLIDVSYLTSDDYVYFNTLDRIFAVYIDCGKGVGKKEISMTRSDISFYDGGTEEDYIKVASGDFLKVGFEAGMRINISGSMYNDKTVIIQKISDEGDIIYVQTGTLKEETAGKRITISSRIGAPYLKSLEMFNGNDWIQVTNFHDGTNGLTQSGFLVFDRTTSAHKSQFNNSPYHSYWFRFKIENELFKGASISLKYLPYYDIEDIGTKGIAVTNWDLRPCYVFEKAKYEIFIPKIGYLNALNGDDLTILRAGDGRKNAIKAMTTLPNPDKTRSSLLIVWQEEKGEKGGCTTLFEGTTATLLSDRVGIMNSKSFAVVDGVLVATETEQNIRTVVFWLSRHGVMMSEGETVWCISDAIQNYFDPTKPECVNLQQTDKMWLNYDATYGCLRLGLVTGTSTIPNIFPIYHIATRAWGFDTFPTGQELSCLINVDSAIDNDILQIVGGASDGFVYQSNYGTDDAGNAITALCTIEFDGEGAEIHHKKLFLRVKAQEAGNIKISVSRNANPAFDSIETLSLSPLNPGEQIRRLGIDYHQRANHFSYRFEGNVPAGGEIYLLDMVFTGYSADYESRL